MSLNSLLFAYTIVCYLFCINKRLIVLLIVSNTEYLSVIVVVKINKESSLYYILQDKVVLIMPLSQTDKNNYWLAAIKFEPQVDTYPLI